MLNFQSNQIKLLFIFVIGSIFFYIPTPEGLTDEAWHLLAIFLATVLGAIINPVPIGMIAMIALLISLLTNTLNISQAFSGFGSYIVWLVVIAFFISRAIIKSNLGKRVAYYFISKLGKSITGLSYGLILTDLFTAPFIPSATARGGGVIYPVAQALSENYVAFAASKTTNDTRDFKKFLMQLCFHANVITSSMFMTAMAGNPLISTLASNVNVNLSISDWALGAIGPGLILLFILPFLIKMIMKPKIGDMTQAPILAKEILKDMGPLSRNEIMVLLIFLMLITLWALGDFLRIDATTTALLGFIILVLTGVINWDDAIGEKEAWRTFLWFASFITLSKFLSEMGVTSWIGEHIKSWIASYNAAVAVPALLIIFFYMHYFFASITVYASVMYVTFAMLLISFGIPPLASAFILAILANLSACLTHYGITSAPIFFGASDMTVKSWWISGFIVSIFHLLVWSTAGVAWLKILNWI